MPRALRIHVSGAFYHVTLRGNHRQDIFFTPADRQLFEDITSEVLSRFSARLHAFCLMTNHVHLLIQVADAPLGRLMLRIAGQYARRVQARLSTTGHLFERRYHAILVDVDEYLLELVSYIHLNPVRAHMVTHPSQYPWSSHHAYLDPLKQPWVTTDFALRLFHSELSTAMSAYRRFIDRGLHASASSPLKDVNPSDRRLLGSDEFAKRILDSRWQPISRKTLRELVNEACQLFSVDIDALLSSSRAHHLAKARAWIAHQAVTLRVASVSEVARFFHRSEASLREGVKRHFNYP